MSDFYEKMAARDRMDRTLKMARTYLRKAEAYLYPYRGAKGEIIEPLSPPSWLYWDLLDQSLQAALAIIEKLPDDFFEATQVEDILGLGVGGSRHNSSDEPLERAEKLLAAIEKRRGDANRRRKIAALENNTSGRTEAEIEAFRAGAERLRAR